jgi:hypothetical protein
MGIDGPTGHGVTRCDQYRARNYHPAGEVVGEASTTRSVRLHGGRDCEQPFIDLDGPRSLAALATAW